MLETYPTKKFHLSPEIEVVEVENVGFPSDSLCKLHREFDLKIVQNQAKWKVFQLPPPLSPSSSGIFEWNKFLACLVMSQLVRKPSLKEIGAVTKKWHRKKFIDPPSERFSNYYPHMIGSSRVGTANGHFAAEIESKDWLRKHIYGTAIEPALHTP